MGGVWGGPVGESSRGRVIGIHPIQPQESQVSGVGSSTTVGQPGATYFTSTGTTATITGLELGRTYRVQVRAKDAAGNTSNWSTEIFVTPVNVPTPGTVAATATIPGPAVIVPGPTPSTVAATTTIATPPAGFQRALTSATNSVTVTGLTPNRQYTVRVRAYDAAGNKSGWSTPYTFSTTNASIATPTTVAAVASIPGPAIGGAPPTLTAGLPRPVKVGSTVGLDVGVVPPGGATVTSYSWAITAGSGSLTNSSTATPTYTPPGAGSGTATIRVTVTTSNGGTAFVDTTVSYHATVIAAENALTGTARATWDLSSPNLGGVSTLQGFCDGFTVDKTGTANFKIAQSDTAGWTAEVFRLGYYNGDGARSYGTITPSGGQVTASQSQPAPADADPDTTLLSADCAGWSTTLTWTPPTWAPSGIYVLRLNRTGGGASHILFIVRDDARQADILVMPSDSTWNAYNAWGGMGGSMYSGNSLYLGTAVNQYDADCARYVSYNRPVVNRGAADSGRSYGAVEWSTFFTGEYPMVRFLERNGFDVKYYGCIDAGGDPNGTHLRGNGTTRGGAKTGMFIGHNEYWSDNMRAGWELAKNRGVNVFSCASNEVFWRLIGSDMDADGRPRKWECYKSTIAARGSTGRSQWTGTWRDPDGAGKGGNQPENTFTGTIFVVNGPDLRSLVVPFAGGYSAEPLWRHSTVAALTTGQSYTSPSQILGFEWDTYGPAGCSTTGASFLAAPHPRARYCSNVTYTVSGMVLTDAGDVYGDGDVTHRLVVHPGGAGGLVFGTGTLNWAFGLDEANTYQIGSDNTSTPIRQATVNMLVDMGATPATLMGTLTSPTPVDWYPDIPTATVAAVAAIPAPSFTIPASPAVSTVVATAAIPSPTIVRGATATPATVAATATVPAPTVRLSVLPAPATVTAVTAMPAPTTSGAGAATPATVVAVASVATPNRVSAATASVSTVAAVAAIPAPSVQTSSAGTAAPSTVTAVASVPAATVVTAGQVVPATVTAAASIPGPAVSAGATATPATVAATAGVASPSLGGGASVQPATVPAVAAVATPTVIATNSPVPGTVVAVTAIPGPTPRTSITVTVATVAATASIPGPTVGTVTSPPVATVVATASIPAAQVRLFAAVTVATIQATASIGQIRHTVGQIITSTETAKVIGVTLPGRII